MHTTRANRHLSVLLGHVRLDIELPGQISQSWTGGEIWDASIVLGSWLARKEGQDLVKDKRVLELGCGCAPLPSAVAACVGAAEVLATDGDEAAIELASRNLQQCTSPTAHLQGHCQEEAAAVRVEKLEWGKLDAISQGEHDVILFADAVYTESAAVALADCIVHCLMADDSEAVILGAIPHRRIGSALFCRCLHERGFEAKEVARHVEMPPQPMHSTTALNAAPEWRRKLLEMPVSIVQWRSSGTRGSNSLTTTDEGHDLAACFDSAISDAERTLEKMWMRTGYVPEE